MPMNIYTNMPSISAQRQLNKNDGMLALSMQRLSSGLRVNSSRDDASGLAIATRMDTQVRGMNVAMRNANDGISLAQVAEGAIGELTGILQRMRDLAVQSSNTGAVSNADRNKLSDEFVQMGQELGRIIQNTSFNGLNVLQGGASKKNFQVGAGASAHNQISITVTNMSKQNGLSIFMTGTTYNAATGAVWIGSHANGASKALSAIRQIDRALDNVNNARSRLGAIQSRFQATISNLSQSVENISAAKSRIMDTDFASETSNLSRAQILQQAGTAMLAQANQSGQSVMSLLR